MGTASPSSEGPSPRTAVLPTFKAPPSRNPDLDRPLPPVDPPEGTASSASPSGSPEPTTSPRPSLLNRLSSNGSQSGESDAQPPGITSTDRSTRRKPGGDPKVVAETLAGLVLVVVGIVAGRLWVRGRQLREPTPAELADITEPLGRIAVRHLPMDAFSPDLADATQAVAATHRYVRRGPLVTRRADDTEPLES